MRLSQFLDMHLDTHLEAQLIDVIEWDEPEAGTLAYRYPMLDMEIQTGARLMVREAEMAVFVDQGRVADVFGPGLYALNPVNLPLLSELKGWGKGFAAPFKADIYFFTTDCEIDPKWGTPTPILLGDREAGAILLRGYGTYSYRIAAPRTFFAQVSGTRESYFTYDLDDRLRRTLAAGLEEVLVASGVSYPSHIANAAVLSDKVVEHIKPAFAALGLELAQFTIQNISLQDELQPLLDERMGTDARCDFQSSAPRKNCGCCGASLRADRGVLKCDYCHDVVVSGAGDDGAGVVTESEARACPACAIPLLQATIGGASLLYCTRCDGMLVEMDEFASLVAASRALAGGAVPVEAAKPADFEHSIACPQCRRAMEVHFYGGNVAIDNCESCGLNWLDHGELARIAHAPGAAFGLEADSSNAYFNSAHADGPAGANAGA